MRPIPDFSEFSTLCNEILFYGTAEFRKDSTWNAIHHAIPIIALTSLALQTANELHGPPIFAEIGVDLGVSTVALLTAAAMTNGRLISMDVRPELEMPVRNRILNMGLPLRSWQFDPGRSQDHAPIPGMNLLLVDGDHSYNAVCEDMRVHGPHVRPGGIIVLDDYSPKQPGKQQWIEERWDILKPMVIGAYAFWRHEEGMEKVYA